jgi:hypothetical protein
MRELIASLRDVPGLRIEDRASAWALRLTHLPGFEFEVVVPHSVLEWFATARDTPTGREVWSDWMDYAGYGPKNTGQLTAEMANDVHWFLTTLLGASGFRVKTERS